MYKKLNAYMSKYKLYEDSSNETMFTKYVHVYWISYLQYLIENGLLKNGKAVYWFRANIT